MMPRIRTYVNLGAAWPARYPRGFELKPAASARKVLRGSFSNFDPLFRIGIPVALQG
jgi:hypothetical protein